MSKTLKVHAIEVIGFYGTSENDFANSANSCNELDTLTGKHIKLFA